MKQKRAQRATNEDKNPSRPDPRRIVARMFLFWTVCRPRCRRAKACVGDSQWCFNRCWPHVPEDLKNALRLSIKARSAGMTPEEADRHVATEMARWDEIERAEQAAGGAPIDVAPPPLPDAAPPDAAPAGPRIRRL